MKAKENPLNQSVTGNPYYDYLIHEVQVVCNCPTDKAMAIVSYVNSLGSSPIKFIRKLPDYVGNPHPDADEVLQALENIREDHGVQKYGTFTMERPLREVVEVVAAGFPKIMYPELIKICTVR